ncbi:NPC intracellular cholesterol transporter 1-like isoform X1 [Ixodes scapularis]|uniref:NPC intracellular cholesterol transporter 1-like isoform X1 n=1 Tax=Ixodes scapularis TaxID=6945 RepID=UPI0011255DED|nr:NPC intracellular cholesterol transporter 1-like isoform X1 [Ixodes scapularis]
MGGTGLTALSLLALLHCFTGGDAIKCSMRGFCDAEKKLPCAYFGKPKAIESAEARNAFTQVCGDYFKEPTELLCCDEAQIAELVEQFKTVESLGLRKCEACYANFQKVLCNMVCSPHQGDHVQLIQRHDNQNHDTVDAIKYFADYKLLRGLYGSCMNAKKVIQFLPLSSNICGKDYQNCTMNLWFGALGKKKAGLSSVDVTYVPLVQDATFTDVREYRAFKDVAFGCNETVAGKTCSCEDCEALCQDANDSQLSNPDASFVAPDPAALPPSAPASTGGSAEPAITV